MIIDALTSREPWNKNAEAIFIMAANHMMDMYITASSATDIYYLVRKHLHSTEHAKNVMAKLYELFRILDVTLSDCQEALSSQVNDYEDAVLSCCAFRNHIDYIITRNIKDYEKSKIHAILPKTFINMVIKDEK